MSPKLPRVTARDALRALHRADWYDARQVGSHLALRHPTKPGKVIVPVHPGVILKPATLASILDQAGLTVEDFRRLL